MAKPYRWDAQESAAGYDIAAQFIHPYYEEVQSQVLQILQAHFAMSSSHETTIIDAGGGSGRLVEKLLLADERYRALIVDQSAAFLQLAKDRLKSFGDRVHFELAKLQDSWSDHFATNPDAVVSMSAIHHLEPTEKQTFFGRLIGQLNTGGIFINGDEVCSPSPSIYEQHLNAWWTRMKNGLQTGDIPEEMRPILESWRDRNIRQIDQPKTSGDDCHETVNQQLSYLQAAGFTNTHNLWQKEMWAVMVGVKPS